MTEFFKVEWLKMKILEGREPLWRVLKEYKLRKYVRDTDLTNIQEGELTGFGTIYIRLD